jgi:glucose/arabinose dehydrogenase
LTLLPDGSALVGERTTGRIVRVQPVPNRPVPTVRRLTGLDASGDGGLLDLALSPSYTEDNLIYAYVTTKTDNRVVDFTLHGPVTTVLSGIPKGRTGNAGRLMFGDDGNLYVATGDTGHPALAQNRRSLAGKILRVDPIGDVARGNPSAGSPVFARGVSRVAGLCTSAIIGTIFGVDDSPGAPAEVNRVVAGNDYGYPNAGPTTTDPAAQLPGRYGKSGGCAVLGARLWVTSLDGQALLSAPLLLGTGSPRIGTFAVTLVKRYGRLRTVVAARDGALWLTTSNRDGFGHPISADERVIRLVPSSNSSSSPA